MRKKRRYQKIKLFLLLYFWLAGMIATVGMAIFLLLCLVDGQTAKEVPIQEAAAQGILTGAENRRDTNLEAMDGGAERDNQRIKETGVKSADSPLLVLVNKENPISDDYDPKLRKICKGRLEASEYLYDDLCDMLEAAGKAGYSYWIASAYRSKEYQENNIQKDIQNYRNKGYSDEEAKRRAYEYKLPAGYSEHHTGLALDILCSTNLNMDGTQAGEPGNLWLREHCHEYGFILRYPENREDITGIKYEPWHFRYVGKEAAGYLTENGLVLEEYVS